MEVRIVIGILHIPCIYRNIFSLFPAPIHQDMSYFSCVRVSKLDECELGLSTLYYAFEIYYSFWQSFFYSPIIPNKNHPFSLNLYKFVSITTIYYLFSTQHNISYFRYAGKGFRQHEMLSWTREIFDCGFKFSLMVKILQ